MRIASPEQAFKSMVDRLPRSIGDLLWNVTYLIAWVTLPVFIPERGVRPPYRGWLGQLAVRTGCRPSAGF